MSRTISYFVNNEPVTESDNDVPININVNEGIEESAPIEDGELKSLRFTDDTTINIDSNTIFPLTVETDKKSFITFNFNVAMPNNTVVVKLRKPKYPGQVLFLFFKSADVSLNRGKYIFLLANGQPNKALVDSDPDEGYAHITGDWPYYLINNTQTESGKSMLMLVSDDNNWLEIGRQNYLT